MRLFLSLVALLAITPIAAAADSCWTHNGSVMRLKAAGQQRMFLYEAPRNALRPTGVREGTLLFEGSNVGGFYRGTARVFSSACPEAPLSYYVEGPVSNGQLRVTVVGTREVYRNCQPTGTYTTDTLVFDYSHDC